MWAAPLKDMAQKFTDPDLLTDAQAVLEKLTPIEKEVVSQSRRVYMRRALPYRTSDNRIAGVVVTFVDVTVLRPRKSKMCSSARAASRPQRRRGRQPHEGSVPGHSRP